MPFETRQVSSMDFSGVHILFCDHDPSTGFETLSLLHRCSYKVTSVKSAREVVDTLRSGDSDVDIVLTDVELPQEKGFKMLKHILRQENLGHIAVVVMSEHDEMAVVAKCLHLGAVDYLVKPLRSNEVMNLWTHMWRKRRMMGLPDKHGGLTSMNVFASSQKLDTTGDLLSGHKNTQFPVYAKDTGGTFLPREDTSPKLELSLRLAVNYNAERLPEQANAGAASLDSLSTPAQRKAAYPSAFSTYLKSCSLQPDELSGTNACSPSSSHSKRSVYSSECLTRENQESVGGLQADASLSSPKDASCADETRPADTESHICDRSRILHAGQTSSTHTQGFQQSYAFMASPPVHMQQGVTANVQEVPRQGYLNQALNPSYVQQRPPYCHEPGMANMPPVLPNIYSYYPVAHLAVPVVNFSMWPALVTLPPIVGGKLNQAEMREAALSKFRLKRKGRCFEKKIRYASRKKLAEQRPRVRGQFVKRSALVDNAGIQALSDEEGEADDEQGCSELDNNSSPDCIAEECRVG